MSKIDRWPSDVSAAKREYLDQFDRRIGYMWPEDFIAYNAATWGRKWRQHAARFHGVSQETIAHWTHGTYPIPKTVAMCTLLLRKLVTEHNKSKGGVDSILPDMDLSWLSE